MGMLFPQLPVGAFFAAALVLIPLPWHWRAKNVGTLAIITWLFVINMIYGINAIVWNDNVNNPAPVWCDITTKIIIGASSALPIATMCVCKHLELVSSTRRVRLDSADKRRRIIFDSLMCFGLPLIFMALHYVVQGHRFDIVENLGCQPATYFSIPGVMIVWVPPLFFAVLTLIYASIALYHFIQRRLSFAAHLQNSNSALTMNRYMRLMAMSIVEIVWGTAFTAYNIWSNVSPGLRPWISWANVHSNFSRVDLYVTTGIPPDLLARMFLFWWAMPASAFIFFVFFGFGEEALKEYKKVFLWFRRNILRQTVNDQSAFYTKSFPNSSHRKPVVIGTLPTFNIRPDEEKGVSSFGPTSSCASMPPTPTKGEKSDDGDDSSNFSPLPRYTEAMPSPSSDSSSSHHIEISDAFPASRPPTPPAMSSVPAYHRPFSPPTVFPVVSPQASRDSILVTVQTVHRQADDIV